MEKSLLYKKIEYYKKLEQEIIYCLNNLENESSECVCDVCKTIDFVHDGGHKEIITRCVNCGGFIDNS